jgi:hypothetical protein
LPVFFYWGGGACRPYHFPVSHSFPVTSRYFPLLPITAIFYSSPIYILFNDCLANADYRCHSLHCRGPGVPGRRGCGGTIGSPGRGCGGTIGSPGRGCGGTIGSPGSTCRTRVRPNSSSNLPRSTSTTAYRAPYAPHTQFRTRTGQPRSTH